MLNFFAYFCIFIELYLHVQMLAAFLVAFFASPCPELSEQVADVRSDLKGESPWHAGIRSVIFVTSDVE